MNTILNLLLAHFSGFSLSKRIQDLAVAYSSNVAAILFQSAPAVATIRTIADEVHGVLKTQASSQPCVISAGTGEERPTRAERLLPWTHYRELKKSLQALLANWDALRNRDVSALNEYLKRHNLIEIRASGAPM